MERETGLSKDTLRVWERRYGFPQPTRDVNGERIYTPEQVEKLRLLRRLTERGMRPGKIISLDLRSLENLGMNQCASDQERPDLARFLALLREPDVSNLRRHLTQTLMRQGLHSFVLDTVSPLNDLVAAHWMRGDLELFEEHLYAEQMQGVLRSAIHAIQHEGRAPCVLLASLTSESRTLLMMEAVLSVGGAICVPLGAQTPVREIARAVGAHRADVVGLSIKGLNHETTSGLAELRTLLAPGIKVWACCNDWSRLKRPPQGIEFAHILQQVPDLLQQWRSSRGQ